nr:hypothetical protein [Tanacetum cinerariifolium]
MDEGLSIRMLMEHNDTQGQSVFTSRAWIRLFEIRGMLVQELILEFFSTFRFIIYNIAERSQAPKTVIVTDLFYLRGMDVGSVNVPYLLARLERKPDVAVGALVVMENALVVDESALARRRVRQRTGDASTSAAPLDEDQPDP